MRVDCERGNHCARCAAGRGCGGAFFGRLLGDRRLAVDAVGRDSSLRAGDPVVLELQESIILRAAALAYLVPLLGLVAGALSGQRLAAEPGAMLGAAVGLAVAWAIAGAWSRARPEGLRPCARRP